MKIIAIDQVERRKSRWKEPPAHGNSCPWEAMMEFLYIRTGYSPLNQEETHRITVILMSI